MGDDDQEFRNSVIGASEIAVLYGVSPWLTMFQLWHEKNGTIPPREFATTEAQQAGVRMEKAIVDWACDKWGYTRKRTPKRVKFPARGKPIIGGHPDQLATDSDGKSVVLEIKTVDRMAYALWEGGEPPLQYQLQALAYTMMSGANYGVIVALVGGNQLERWIVERDPVLWNDICRRAKEFWASIGKGEEPPPDFYKDGEAIRAAYGSLNIEHVNLTGEAEFKAAVQSYREASEAIKAASAQREAAKAKIEYIIGQEAFASGQDTKPKVQVTCDEIVVKSTLVKGSPDRPAEPGEIIKGRKDHRRLFFNYGDKGKE